MSETTPEAPAATAESADQPSTETPAQPETDSDTALGDAGKKAIDRMKAERDAARKEARANADAAKRLADMEESQKSEQQKITDRAAKAERERDDARAEGLRYRAAAKHGVGEDYFDLLGSGDEETIDTRAQRIGDLLSLRTENDSLKAELQALKTGKPVPSRPTEALRPGATPAQIPDAADDAYPADLLPRRMRERISGSPTST